MPTFQVGYVPRSDGLLTLFFLETLFRISKIFRPKNCQGLVS